MQLHREGPLPLRTEFDVARDLVPLDGARLLELGCGRAEATQQIARACPRAEITALEVDAAQHALNVEIRGLPNVRFGLGGAEAIPAGDGEFDAVLMFKSLHHVPAASLGAALGEIHRVLRRDGLALFVEPVYAGDFNEILRIFHDEQRVRELAFDALRDAVASGRFELVAEEFYARAQHYDSFADFERLVLQVTHTAHRLSDAQYAAVRERFMRQAGAGGADFVSPMRADLLRRRDR